VLTVLTGAEVTLRGQTVGFAYLTNEFEHNVTAYRIDSTGALLPVAFSPFSVGAGPDSVTVNSTGQFAYVANSGSVCSSGQTDSDAGSWYSIEPATGALTPMGEFPSGLGPASVRPVPITTTAGPPVP
jgi:DNA-binding beta-propeller fold protein YncE